MYFLVTCAFDENSFVVWDFWKESFVVLEQNGMYSWNENKEQSLPSIVTPVPWTGGGGVSLKKMKSAIFDRTDLAPYHIIVWDEIRMPM